MRSTCMTRRIEAADDVEDRHERHEPLADARDRADAAEDHERGQHGHDGAGQPRRHAERLVREQRATEFACTMLPMPKAATAVNAAKTTPSQRMPMPRSSTYIGPPAIVPVGRGRCGTSPPARASAYLVAIPKTPVSQIQSTAPGPARRDRGRDADDVAGADGRGERGRERAELADVALALGIRAEARAGCRARCSAG